MPKELIFDGETLINATDWKAKSEHITNKLNEELFDNIKDFETYDDHYDKEGNLLSRKKHNLKRGELMPIISPAQVTTKLNRLLRVYKPMNLSEAMTLKDTDYLDAYGYYLDIISHINKFVTFLPDKQSFSAFCNISTDTYNQLLTDQHYCQVFSSIEDGFVQSNFAVAEAGLIDSKATITKLQTKDKGHNLVKNPESFTINYSPKVDKVLINQQLDKFLGMTKQIGKGENKQ